MVSAQVQASSYNEVKILTKVPISLSHKLVVSARLTQTIQNHRVTLVRRCTFIVSCIILEVLSRKSYFEHLHMRNRIATITIACPTRCDIRSGCANTLKAQCYFIYRGHSCLLFKEEKETWQENRLCGAGNTHGLRHPPHCRLKWTVTNQSRELSESNSKGLTHKFMLKKMQL